jgi:hypothetical protein
MNNTEDTLRAAHVPARPIVGCFRVAAGATWRSLYGIGSLRAIVLASGIWAISAAPVKAQIAANFDGGNSTSVVDAFIGKTGDGWLSGWTTSGGSAPAGTVVNTTPLVSGGGNYLSSSVANIGASASSGLVFRKFDSSLTTSPSYTVSFNFRLDTALAGAQVFNIFAANTASLGGPSAADLWEISVQANSNGGKWKIGSNATTMLATQGLTYAFTLTITPGVGYTASIFNGTTTYTTPSIAFRTGSSTGDYLYFGATSVAASTTVGYSIDSIVISSIPEPADIATIFASVSLLAAMGGIVRRRRHRA